MRLKSAHFYVPCLLLAAATFSATSAHAQLPFPGFEEKGPELRFAGQDELLDRIDRFLERVDKRLKERTEANQAVINEYEGRLEPIVVPPEVTPLAAPAPAVEEAEILRAEFNQVKEMTAREQRLLQAARTLARRARESAVKVAKPLPDPVVLNALVELELRARRMRARLAQEDAVAERLEALAEAEAAVTVADDPLAPLERALHAAQSLQARARSLETRAVARSLTQQAQLSLPSLSLLPKQLAELQTAAKDAEKKYEDSKADVAVERRKLRSLISDGRRDAEMEHKLGLAMLVKVDRQLKLHRAEAELAATKAWASQVLAGRTAFSASEANTRRRVTASQKARLEASWPELEQALVESKGREDAAKAKDAELAGARTKALEEAVARHLETRQRLEASEVVVEIVETRQEIPVSRAERWQALGWTVIVLLLSLGLIIIGLRVFARTFSPEDKSKRRFEMSDTAAARWSTVLSLLWPLLISAVAAAIVVWWIWRLDVGVGQAWETFDRPLFYVESEAVSALSVVKLFVTLWAAVVVSRTIRQVLSVRVFPRFAFDSGLTNAINTMVHYVIIVLGVVIGLRFVGVGLSSLAIFAGILGIGIGFGLRNITENFISGLIILAERPVKIGDYIHLDNDVEGRVDSIRARSTTLTTRDNISVIIPNSEFVSKNVVNWSHGDPKVRVRVNVGVAYGSNTNLVRKTLLEVAKNHGQVLKKPAPEVQFVGFGASSLDFALLVWIDEQTHRFRIASDLHFGVDAAFRRNNIEISFPQMDLHFKSFGEQLQSVLQPFMPPLVEDDGTRPVEPAPLPEAGRRLPPRSDTTISRLPRPRAPSVGSAPAKPSKPARAPKKKKKTEKDDD